MIPAAHALRGPLALKLWAIEPKSHVMALMTDEGLALFCGLAQDADAQVFCYANADIRKGGEAKAIFRFIDFWTTRHGGPPRHQVFDSKPTTYHGLDRLDQAGITFLTLRRRSPKLLAEIDQLPPSAWRTITLDLSHRKYRTPRV